MVPWLNFFSLIPATTVTLLLIIIEIERDLALLSYLIDPFADNRRRLAQIIALLGEYRDTLV